MTRESRTSPLALAGDTVLAAPSDAAAPAAAPRAAAPPAAAERPNILLILADDMGFSDLGCYGSEIATPNLDRLAAGGLRFTRFYNCARCCPSRAALLTGLYPHQAGVGHMVEDAGLPGYRGHLNDRCATIAELLREGGYDTSMAGKWHVSPVTEPLRHNWPLQRGFERFFGTPAGGHYFRPPGLMRDNARIEPEGDFYYTDALSDHAVQFIEGHGREAQRGGGKPFFLYLAYTAPHWPLQARPPDIAPYLGSYRDGWDALRRKRCARMAELGTIDAGWPLSPRDPGARPWAEVEGPEEWDRRMAVYAAMVTCMDRGIGRVLDAVSRIGATENTLVLFLSDNGASAESVDRGHQPGAVTGTPESYRCPEVGWANASNTPFRRHKKWVHEGGISTPLIVHWPARIHQHGALTGELGHLIDLLPTCLDVAGVEYPQRFAGRDLLPLEGRSLRPLLEGGRREGHETLCWEHEGNRAVRQGRWKLVAEHGGPWEFYDMEADRTELNDLAPREPGRVRELAAHYDRWAERCGVRPWDEVRERLRARRGT